jgi:FkbM family methyltransferase
MRALLRSVLEKLSRGRVLRRRLPEELGGHALYVSPDAAMKLWQRDLAAVDPILLRMASELVRPGMVVWDIGANVGLFGFAAAFAAGPSGRVLAVEADGWLAELIGRSAREAPAAYARLEVLAAAVSDVPGTAELCIARRGRAGNHLRSVAGSTQTGGTREVIQVAAITLDGLLDRFPAPQVVKIDIEGAEVLCLRGAARLLREIRPILLCEVTEENAAEAGALLRGHGYTLFDAGTPAGQRQSLDRPPWNTLALPGVGRAG